MKFLFCSYLFFLSIFLQAQTANVYHEVFSKKDGLAIDVIEAMAFDNDGYLWLGGSNLDVRTIIYSDKKLMLQRFNGNTFHSIPLPEHSERITMIRDIYKRKDGKFYVQTANLSDLNELFLFDPMTAIFTLVNMDWDPSIAKGLSKVFAYQGKDYILVQRGREITLNILDESLNLTTLFSFTTNENKFLLEASTVFIPSEDYVIIGDDNFPITVLDWQGNVLERYAANTFHRNRDNSVSKFWIDELFTIQNEYHAIISQDPRIHRIDMQAKKPIALKGKENEVDALAYRTYNDSLGNHMIAGASDGVLSLYEMSQSGLENIYETTVFKGNPSLKLLSSDLKKELWLATNQGELHYFKFPSKNIKQYLPSYALRTIKAMDSLYYLIATDAHGWFTLNKETEEIQPYSITESGNAFLPKYSRNFIFEGDTLWSNSGGGILKVDTKTQDSKYFRHYPVANMLRPTDSTIVYGTNGYNLMEFNTRTETHRALIRTDTLEIIDASLSPDKRQFVGATDKGVLVYDLQNQTTAFYGKDFLEDPYILMVTHSDEHGFLFGTRAGLIIAFDIESKSFEVVYRDAFKAGIAAVVFDDQGKWWINTFNGLVAYDEDKKSRGRFSVRDGLSNNEGNRYSSFKSNEGIYFGAIRGLNFFKPEKLQPDEEVEKLQLLRLRKYNKREKNYVDVFDRTNLLAAGKATQIISLPTENRALEIDFALSGTDITREETYRYRMNDGEWVDLRSTPSIRFANLEAGAYALDIEALDFSGNTMGDTLSLEIDVPNFFYKTWWFYLILSLLSISILGWMLYQLRIRSQMQIRFAHDLMDSQEVERTRIAKELHDSVGQQLTLIKQRAQQNNHTEMAALTNATLEEVRTISRGLYPAILKQLGLTGSIEQLLLDIDEQTNMFVSIDVEDIDSYFDSQESLNLYRYIQESVSNVLKHSEAQTLVVTIEVLGSSIQVQIRDNGKGFDSLDKLKLNTLGLKTLQERIRMLKGSLQIDSKTNEGTVLTALIPKKR